MGHGDGTQRAASLVERELEESGVGASPSGLLIFHVEAGLKAAATAVGFPAIYVNVMFLSPAVQILQCPLVVSVDTLGGGKSILRGFKLLIPAASRWLSPWSIFP